MTLTADLRVGDRLGVELAVAAGEVVAVVGPNGAGKTTLLRALAGVEPAAGSALLDGIDLLALPVERRGVGWVPQAGLLFPHLTARDNVAYGLGGRRGRAAAQALLDRFGVGQLADRRPAQLSGGQAQRVALARALAVQPRLVLLDEPLAALDAATRDEVRVLLRTLLPAAEAPVLLVTHDPVDVVALADRVLVLEAGRVVQDEPTERVLVAPRSPWVAGLLGLNAWRGTSRGDGQVTVGAATLTAVEAAPPGDAVLVLVAPHAVSLHRSPPSGSPRNVLHGPVTGSSALAGRVRVTVASEPPVTAEVTPAAARELRLAEGGPVWASFKATEVQLVRV